MTAGSGKTLLDFLVGGGEMGARIRTYDWNSTPLGPVEFWPHSLKTSVSLILGSRHPMWIGWGREMTFLYNDAYLHVLGPAKHPRALGRPASEVWAEIWNVCGPLADKVFERGEASFMDDVRLLMDRGSSLEETFYSFSYSPIRNDEGDVCGLFCPSTDVSPKVLNARRLATLSQLTGNTLLEKTTAAACATAAETLARNPDDIPFALLYLSDPEGRRAVLEQQVGDFAPDLVNDREIPLDSSADSSPWPIAEVYRGGHRLTVAADHVEGLPLGVAGRRVLQAVVLPVASRGENYGVLVAGINPCRELDADHLTFFELVASQVATAIQNARAAEEEKSRSERLAELDRAKTVFFSNVSHEFRTPLTLMLGPIENLLAPESGLAPRLREQLAIAQRNSVRLLKLVNSLLDFSRLEAGRLKASYAPTDLCAFTADLASNFRSAFEAAGLDFRVECEPLPQPVYLDREMWEKVVLNLLSNAFKFTFEGRIVVRLEDAGGRAVLTVSDTGIGIPQEELPRIFERFHRVAGARGRSYEGTGIGLALIQEYVKLHGGEISVASRPGEGTAFTVTLPFGTAHLPADRIEGSAPSRPSIAAHAWVAEISAAPAAVSEESASSKPRILLADDNPDMREHVTRILGSDYRVATASDGREAFERILANPPDLVLTDVMMPRMDGVELLRAIRADVRTRMLPVLFLSARAGEEMRVEGLEAGADDYLVKPFTATELRARVGTHVQMAIARREATERESKLRAEAETLNEVSRALAGELDLEKLLQTATDAAVKVTGAQFGVFEKPGDSRALPVELGSHLAVPVAGRHGDLLGRFLFGHAAPGVFTKHAERLAGGIAAFAAIAIDNAQLLERRRQTEELLRQSEQRFREMIDALPAAIYTTDSEGFITHFNPAAVELSGRQPVLHSDRWTIAWKLMNPDGTPLPHNRCPMAQTLLEGRVTHGAEWIGERPDGGRYWVESYPTPLRDSAGKLTGGINMLVDITGRKNAERALRLSEERFRGVFESSAVGVSILTLETQFLQVNHAFCGITGYSGDELRSLHCASLTHPEDRVRVFKLVAQLIEGAVSTFSIEERLFTRDERVIWVNLSVSTMRDAHGRPEYLIALAEDITARKQAEAALKDSEERFRAIVETTPECVKLVAPDGAVLLMNSPGLALVGANSADAVLGKSVYQLVAPEFREAYRNFNQRVCAGESGTCQFDIIGLHGQRRQMETHAVPLRRPDGQVVQLGITRDVTERKRSEDAIRDLNRQLTSELQAMTLMQQLSTKLVHGDDFTELISEIIDAAMEIAGAAMGDIHLLENGMPRLVSRRGSLAVTHAIHSTRLVTRSGELLGILSTHYADGMAPADRELRLLDVLARQAADLVERKRAESALRASEARFRQLADSMPIMVWTANPDGGLDYYNERWYEFTGAPRDQFGDATWSHVLHPEDADRCVAQWHGSVTSGASYRIEFRLWDRRELRWRWFMASALPVRGDQGEIVKWFGASIDIDDQKRVEDELRHANQDLEQFAYSASHDLQEPLRSIKIYGELLSKRYGDRLDGQAFEFLEFLRAGASRMEMLVRDLLAYTQVTRIDVPAETTDANEVLAATIATLDATIRESRSHITWEPLPQVRVHHSHLGQLFQNLIGNAIKYRKPDCAPQVHVTCERQNASWVFQVRDNGIGVDPEYKEHIFGLFKRLHTGDEYSGTGIGLAICQRIAERYHGRIWVESSVGRGSSFFFALPA